MEVEYAIVLYVQLTPDILVPNEWPLSGIHNIIRKLAKEIIMQNDHEDPILQVDGMPARIGRYVGKQGFYYVFNKVSKDKRKILDINPDACVAYRRSVKRMYQIPEDCVLEMD